MSRTTETEAAQLQAGEKQTVRCLLLSPGDVALLLPNTAIAEVTEYRPPETTQNAPDWFLGIFSWRGRRIPLVAFENFFKKSSARKTPRQVAVLNSLNGNPELPFIAITMGSLPRLLSLDGSSIEYATGESEEGDPKEDESGAIIARVNVSGEPAVIPNINFIEDRIVQLGI